MSLEAVLDNKEFVFAVSDVTQSVLAMRSTSEAQDVSVLQSVTGTLLY